MQLTIGKEYKRTDLHVHFGGQRQGGISTPKNHPVVLLFTGEEGKQFGYRDGFQDDGVFWYTGEGQVGDMQMKAGNKAILNAEANGKTTHLFEYVRTAYVRYLSKCNCNNYHHALAPDRNGDERRVIVFELILNGDEDDSENNVHFLPTVEPKAMWGMELSVLRKAALSKPHVNTSQKQARKNVYTRSEAVKVYVLRRANGTCEGCGKPAPFKRKNRKPYLEPHHIHRLADGGPDHPAHVAALCPNCHRQVHYGSDGVEYNQVIAEKILSLEDFSQI